MKVGVIQDIVQYLMRIETEPGIVWLSVRCQARRSITAARSKGEGIQVNGDAHIPVVHFRVLAGAHLAFVP